MEIRLSEKVPALAGWQRSRKTEAANASLHECPTWIQRVQRQGLSPAALEAYLEKGWPVRSIALARNLEPGDIAQCMARWIDEV